MGKNPAPPVNVQLNRVKDTNGNLVWEMDAAGHGKGGPGNYPKLKVNAGDSGTKFHFTIGGPNTQNVTFLPVATSPGPLCVAPDTNNGASPPCPSSSDQIIDINVNGKTLTFTDINTVGGDLVYQLNFVGAPALDPVIQNGGGGVPPRNYESIALIVGGILLLVIAATFVWKRLQKSNRNAGV